jgi:hypothetical protein
MSTYNIYCDESCHLENDHQQVMVLGAIWCPLEKTREISVRVREIKVRHGLNPKFEVKWTKVSPAQKKLYLDLIDYFFDADDLHFRALIVPDKTRLQHDKFHQDHDIWYYKMYFEMLKVILSPDACYRVYLDIKDTRSALKVARLHEILCNNIYDFQRKIIERVQTVHSKEVELLQLTDLMVGAISYVNREMSASNAKLALVERIKKRSNYELTRTTLLLEKKVNLFRWQATEVQ